MKTQKQKQMKKELTVLITLLIAIGIIGHSSVALSRDLNALQESKLTELVDITTLSEKTHTDNPVANNEVLETTYEVIGVELNENQKKVANQIIKLAENEQFKWIPFLVELAWCESRLGEIQIHENSNGAGKDRGIFQINDYWHKDISDDQAFDLEWSAKWTMNMINKGYQNRWACNQIILHNDIKIELKPIDNK